MPPPKLNLAPPKILKISLFIGVVFQNVSYNDPPKIYLENIVYLIVVIYDPPKIYLDNVVHLIVVKSH